MNTLVERLATGRFDSQQAVDEHGGKDVDHLPVAIADACQSAPHPLDGSWQHPVFEWRPVAQGAGLPGQHRHVMPGVLERLAAGEGTRVLADQFPVLAYDDAN